MQRQTLHNRHPRSKIENIRIKWIGYYYENRYVQIRKINLQIITLKRFDFSKFIFLISTVKYGRIERNVQGCAIFRLIRRVLCLAVRYKFSHFTVFSTSPSRLITSGLSSYRWLFISCTRDVYCSSFVCPTCSPPPRVRELNDVHRWSAKRFSMIYMSIPRQCALQETGTRRIALHIY